MSGLGGSYDLNKSFEDKISLGESDLSHRSGEIPVAKARVLGMR